MRESYCITSYNRSQKLIYEKIYNTEESYVKKHHMYKKVPHTAYYMKDKKLIYDKVNKRKYWRSHTKNHISQKFI